MSKEYSLIKALILTIKIIYKVENYEGASHIAVSRFRSTTTKFITPIYLIVVRVQESVAQI